MPDAVPYEEDERDHSIWFLDHSYLENMSRMFKKVNGAVHIPAEAHACPALLSVQPEFLIRSSPDCSKGAYSWLVQHWAKAQRS